MTAADVASALGLHHNTVREHLDALIDAGLVEVSTRPTGRRGRPALRYASTAPSPTEVLDSYLTLLNAISQTLGTCPQARVLALETRRRCARMTPPPETHAAVGAATPAQRAPPPPPHLPLLGPPPDPPGRPSPPSDAAHAPLSAAR